MNKKFWPIFLIIVALTAVLSVSMVVAQDDVPREETVIFDIDGVLEYQGQVYPHAADTIRVLRNRGLILRFLTNSLKCVFRSIILRFGCDISPAFLAASSRLS